MYGDAIRARPSVLPVIQIAAEACPHFGASFVVRCAAFSLSVVDLLAFKSSQDLVSDVKQQWRLAFHVPRCVAIRSV
jgi:hypothetical protein